MPLFFNIAGPCVPGEHYLIDPMRGIDDKLMELIDSKQYFANPDTQRGKSAGSPGGYFKQRRVVYRRYT